MPFITDHQCLIRGQKHFSSPFWLQLSRFVYQSVSYIFPLFNPFAFVTGSSDELGEFSVTNKKKLKIKFQWQTTTWEPETRIEKGILFFFFISHELWCSNISTNARFLPFSSYQLIYFSGYACMPLCSFSALRPKERFRKQIEVSCTRRGRSTMQLWWARA